jgi:hypothetical protein
MAQIEGMRLHKICSAPYFSVRDAVGREEYDLPNILTYKAVDAILFYVSPRFIKKNLTV